MQLHNLIDESFQAFQDQALQAKVILLHPRSRYRSVLVAKLINTPDLKVFYYAMGQDDINLQSFLTGITHDLANQHPTFGRHTNILPQEAYGNTEVLLDTFARDLAEISDQPYYLILDEYDRSDSADDVQMFIEKLVGKLPENCRLVLNSRTLPRLPWVSLIAQKQAVLLEDSRLIRRDFYEIETEGKNKLEVYALGPGYVLMNGQPIDTWEGHLPRLLFFFALDRPIITRSEICQAFWPELDTDQAVNVFHVTKRRLHKALDMDVLVHDGGYYRVNPDLAVQYDVMDFVEALMEGRNDTNPNRIAAWQQAIDMYRGPFLQGHTDRWIVDRRRDFQSGYLEALAEMAYVRLNEDRPEQALGLFQRALAEDSSRESLHRDVMQLYMRLGRRSEAAAHYQRLTEDLKKEGRQPLAETQALYKEIMS
ncbi:MAG TPA: BTAD domain-containing putative transcriptional regulator [Phototrophicaceae bacterium]|nr:BTAD domain-containing putative transcriptional regulator [Phototrophicaceae bacterium]